MTQPRQISGLQPASLFLSTSLSIDVEHGRKRPILPPQRVLGVAASRAFAPLEGPRRTPLLPRLREPGRAGLRLSPLCRLAALLPSVPDRAPVAPPRIARADARALERAGRATSKRVATEHGPLLDPEPRGYSSDNEAAPRLTRTSPTRSAESSRRLWEVRAYPSTRLRALLREHRFERVGTSSAMTHITTGNEPRLRAGSRSRVSLARRLRTSTERVPDRRLAAHWAFNDI